MTVKVAVERNVKQIIDGVHYDGYLIIAGTKFDYELIFATPISRLEDDEKPVLSKEEVRSLFRITVKQGEENIELTDKEYGFFLQMLVEFAIIFYNNPQTRSNNTGAIGELMQGRGIMAAFGASASIGLTNNALFDFPSEVCEMLNDPKFGCDLK